MGNPDFSSYISQNLYVCLCPNWNIESTQNKTNRRAVVAIANPTKLSNTIDYRFIQLFIFGLASRV
jgi:hypothetical protein